MKCKTCKKRMDDISVNFDYECNGVMKRAVHVPACKCPSCNNVVVPDLILGKLGTFAEQEKGNVIDYKKCEEQEAEILTVLDTFNFLGR